MPPSVGDQLNYNLDAGIEYQLWPYSTIEWIAAENRYRARALIEHKTTHDNVAFNSYHQTYADAERAIAVISDRFHDIGTRPVYNVYGQVIEVHTSEHGPGQTVNIVEVLALLWSFQESGP